MQYSLTVNLTHLKFLIAKCLNIVNDVTLREIGEQKKSNTEQTSYKIGKYA